MTTSMKDADLKFLEAVSSVQLDLEGELAIKCTGSCECFFPRKPHHLIWTVQHSSVPYPLNGWRIYRSGRNVVW